MQDKLGYVCRFKSLLYDIFTGFRLMIPAVMKTRSGHPLIDCTRHIKNRISALKKYIMPNKQTPLFIS